MFTLTPEEKKELMDFFAEKSRYARFEDIEYCDFTEYGEGDTDYQVENFGKNCGAKWASHGCSKVVLGFEDYTEYVFKIPFCGFVDYDEFSEEEYSEEFGGANFFMKKGSDWDYCETEEAYYNLAKNYDVSDMFAGTVYIGSINGRPIYISEAMPTVGCGLHYNPSDLDEKLYRDSGYKMSPKVIAEFIAQYGLTRTKQLLYFLKEERISDLHIDNYGYDENGYLRILDYSGFDR